MEKDEAFHPVEVALLGAQAAVFVAQHAAHLLEQRHRFRLATQLGTRY